MTSTDNLERVACRVAYRTCAAQLLSSATYDVVLKFYSLNGASHTLKYKKPGCGATQRTLQYEELGIFLNRLRIFAFVIVTNRHKSGDITVEVNFYYLIFPCSNTFCKQILMDLSEVRKLIGVRYKNITRAIRVDPSHTFNTFESKVADVFDLKHRNWSICKDSECKMQLTNEDFSFSNVKSGTIYFVANTVNGIGSINGDHTLDESYLDDFLDNINIDDITVSVTTHNCDHSSSTKCLKCVKQDPFDEEYLRLRDPPIKHLSFHAYLRKLKVNSSDKYLAMEEISCKVKRGCTTHPPWPRGICTRCQPSGMMLQQQKFRHVDNIMFENSMIADRFLDYWRQSGTQRIGFLFGSYEYYENVPLGIRAVVKFIYEPPQVSDSDSIELLEDCNVNIVDSIANKLGMIRVGWIFTDLLTAKENDGSAGPVQCVRGGDKDLHLLSAQECIMAATFQQQLPNKCRFAQNGLYGSKFVTVVVTGDKDNNINFEGYQVSNQCTSLVRENCLVPTVDAPELACIRESSSKQYVPDVLYKQKDDFGNDVTKLARPLPVEYLLIDVPTAFAVQTVHSLPGYKYDFPIENRSSIQIFQNLDSFLKYFRSFEPDEYLDMFLNFHFLLFLASNEWLSLAEHMDDLLYAVRNKDQDAITKFCEENDSWNTLFQLAQLSDETRNSPWACRMCTFHNQPSADQCEICGESRDEPME
ncbi:hypothetical protein GJ496_009508 [Pomphorhynchus laevis]|nr:hypothetical protein GJ496_009508 [Pomphorhynchus laevis]